MEVDEDPNISVKDAEEALTKLKIFALKNSHLSDKLMDYTIGLTSDFSELMKKQTMKQPKIYDFLVNKLLVQRIDIFGFIKGLNYFI